MQGSVCRCCGQYHDELPLHYGVESPVYFDVIPEPERRRRCVLSSDQCIIDQQHFFIVGNLEIPVIGSTESFSWDVWVSLSERSFERVSELWETEGRENEPPFFGWLSTILPIYPDTLNLKTQVHLREVGRRPLIELEPTDHPLAVEQRTGISWERVQEIAEQVEANENAVIER